MIALARSFSLAAVLATVSLALPAGQASAAQQACGDHDKLATVLASKYKETRRAMGVVNASAVMEIFMSPEGTWTMLITNTQGVACITATGEEWQDVPRDVAGLDS